MMKRVGLGKMWVGLWVALWLSAGCGSTELERPPNHDAGGGGAGAGTISGVVVDEMTEDALVGVDVVLSDGEGDVVGTETSDDEGEFLFEEVDDGDYELSLQAPGLNPEYVIEASGEGQKEVSLGGDGASVELSVEWRRVTDFILDGGVLEFGGGGFGQDLALELPGCEEDGDGNWRPGASGVGGGIDLAFEPEDECFRINGMSVDVATGELSGDVADVVFADVEATVDDLGGFAQDLVSRVEIDFDWIFDDVAGQVDYGDGSLTVDLDFRIMIGGTVFAVLPVDFGSRAGRTDCQLTEAWGGGVSDPTTDEAGEFVHDPIDMALTTGSSGPNEVSGASYDVETGRFGVVDNQATIGRLSEGPLGFDEPGGASCGEADFSFVGIQEDFAGVLNLLLSLPAPSGATLIDVDLVAISGQ